MYAWMLSQSSPSTSPNTYCILQHARFYATYVSDVDFKRLYNVMLYLVIARKYEGRAASNLPELNVYVFILFDLVAVHKHLEI